MKWRFGIFLAIVGAAVIAVIGPAFGLLQTMRLNKATFYTNLNDTDKARQVLETVRGTRDYQKQANRVLGEILAREGSFQQAYSTLDNGIEDRESQFWKGFSAFKLDELTSAAGHFRGVLETRGRLTEEYRQLAELGSAALGNASISFQVPAEPRFNSSVLQQGWNELVGRVDFKNGRWEKAALSFESSSGADTNHFKSRSLACFTYLLAGRYVESQQIVEFSDTPEQLLASLERQLTVSNESFATTSTDVMHLGATADFESRLNRASAWVDLQQSRLVNQGGRSDVKLPVPTSSDPVVQYFRAEGSELNGSYSAAYQIYQRLYESHLNLSALIRAHDLGSDLPSIVERVSAFAGHDGASQFLTVSDLQSTGAQLRPGYLHLVNPGEIGLRHEAAAAGQYWVTLIASAIRAQNKGPLLQLTVNNDPAANLYIPREGWDCYTREVYFEKGLNPLSFSYSAQSDLTGPEENRGINILGILIQEKAARRFEQF